MVMSKSMTSSSVASPKQKPENSKSHIKFRYPFIHEHFSCHFCLSSMFHVDVHSIIFMNMLKSCKSPVAQFPNVVKQINHSDRGFMCTKCSFYTLITSMHHLNYVWIELHCMLHYMYCHVVHKNVDVLSFYTIAHMKSKSYLSSNVKNGKNVGF